MKNDLTIFVNELEAALTAQLDTLGGEQMNPIAASSRALALIADSLKKLRGFIASYTFTNAAEEMFFFKSQKPRFLSQYYFHEQLRTLLLNEPFNLDHEVDNYYRDALTNLQAFIRTHSAFAEYMAGDSAYLDDRYFMRGHVPDENFLTDRTFSTGYDDLVSRLQGSLSLKDHIKYLLDKRNVVDSKSPLTWTGSKADLIELIYGLETTRVINKGDADIMEIVRQLEKVFNISIGNVYRQYLDLRLRKKDKTVFLSQMKERLQERMNDFG